MPLVRSDAVGYVGDDMAWEAHLAICIEDAEGDGVRGVRFNGPVAVIPAVAAAVDRVKAT